MLSVPPGQNILSDILLTSSIVAGEDGAPAGFGGGAGGDFEFGVDPNLDPELALALRISMEEERARQEATQKENGAGDTEMAVEENQGKVSLTFQGATCVITSLVRNGCRGRTNRTSYSNVDGK